MQISVREGGGSLTAHRHNRSAGSFTTASASKLLQPGSFYHSYKTLGVQLGVRTSRRDHGILNITCAFQFLASASHSSDAGKTAVITARMQNSNKTITGWINYGADAPASGYVGLMLGRSASGGPSVQTYAGFNSAEDYSKMGNIPAKPVKTVVLFPIIDVFSADADLTTKEDAFAALIRIGVNVPDGATPPQWSGRTTGIPWGKANGSLGMVEGVLGVGGTFCKNGINATTGGYLANAAYGNAPEVPCYEPNSSCSMHDFTATNATDAELVNSSDISRSVRATFNAAGAGHHRSECTG